MDSVLRKQFFDCSAFRTNQKDIGGSPRLGSLEHNSRPIRTPLRVVELGEISGESEALSAVGPTLPEVPVAPKQGNAVAVSRETRVPDLYSLKKRDKLLRVSILLHEFHPSTSTGNEQPPAILAGNNQIKVHRVRRQSNRLARSRQIRKVTFVPMRPNGTNSFRARHEVVVSAIRRPAASAFVRWLMPAGKQRMKILSIGGNFPK